MPVNLDTVYVTMRQFVPSIKKQNKKQTGNTDIDLGITHVNGIQPKTMLLSLNVLKIEGY